MSEEAEECSDCDMYRECIGCRLSRARAAAKAQGAAEERGRVLAILDVEIEYQCSLVNDDNNTYADCALEVLGRMRDHIKQEPA